MPLRNLPINPWRIKADDEIVYRAGRETLRFRFLVAPKKGDTGEYRAPVALIEGTPWKAALLATRGALTLLAGEKYFVYRV